MWNRIKEYVERNNLLTPNKLYIVALSGGADSVSLLLLLHEAGYHIHAAHCNFHLRGAESERDETFCVDLCARLGVELHRSHFETREWAAIHKVSVEMAARELRYRWFGDLCRDLGAGGVCVAHHKEDSVETVLLNLVRGTGLSGLTGIQPKNLVADTVVLRPLLCVSRQDIVGYLEKRGQQYVTDSTNLETDVLRNKVRLTVMPLLQELNPAVADNIQRTAENLAEAQKVLSAVVDACAVGNTLNIKDKNNICSSEYIAFEWLKQYGFNGRQVRQILAAKTGAVIVSVSGYEVVKDRDRLVVEKQLKPMKPLVIPESGNYRLPVDGQEMAGVLRVEILPVTDDAEPSRLANVITVDASRIRFPLTLRRVEMGDNMHPFGMKGRKLISDLMTDRHMTLFEKRRQLVLTDADGQVVWLVGIRTDNRFRLVKGETRSMMKCSITYDEG
jgi:tRNA(Ile)-lysidine synthase